MTDVAQLLDRVHKLLALATSPNPHEAALAAARAQALVTRHRLEQWLDADITDPITDGADAPFEVHKRIRRYKVLLADAIAQSNGCAAWVGRVPDGESLCVAGRAPDRDVARALYDALVRVVEYASATAGPGRDRDWHESFRIGAADEIAGRLRAGVETARSQTDSAALVRIEARLAEHDARLQRFLEERFGRSKGRSIRVDQRGYRAGREAGAALELPRR